MNEQSIKGQRAELLVEGFLDDLKPSRFAKADSEDLDFDFVVAFSKPDGELKYCAIQVKQTERPVAGKFHFVTGGRFKESKKANIPTVVLIADTKRNELYYGFASQAKIVNAAYKVGFYDVAVPTKKVGLSPAEKRQFIADVLRN